MKKKIIQILKNHGVVNPINIEYWKPSPDYCNYSINFFIDGLAVHIDKQYDIYDKEEGKSNMLGSIEVELLRLIEEVKVIRKNNNI